MRKLATRMVWLAVIVILVVLFSAVIRGGERKIAYASPSEIFGKIEIPKSDIEIKRSVNVAECNTAEVLDQMWRLARELMNNPKLLGKKCKLVTRVEVQNQNLTVVMGGWKGHFQFAHGKDRKQITDFLEPVFISDVVFDTCFNRAIKKFSPEPQFLGLETKPVFFEYDIWLDRGWIILERAQGINPERPIIFVQKII